MTTQREQAWMIAKERFAAVGVDAEAALRQLDRLPVSVHCWQGDDVAGFENPEGQLTGGIQATGNYPGKARNARELRADLELAFSLIPGPKRLNLHAIYLESDTPVSRDAIKPEHFSRWVAWAKENHIGLDFNIGGCCAVVFVLDSEGPVAVDEFVSHDTRDFINNVQVRYGKHDVTVYPDASGRAGRTNATMSDIALIQSAGIRVEAPAKNPFIRDRVNAVNSLLSHGRLAVNINKCPKLTQALETQGYNDKGEPEKFNTHPAIDDWNDSLGYCMHRLFPVNRPAVNIPVSFAL